MREVKIKMPSATIERSRLILAVNSGSSSIKIGLFRMGRTETAFRSGSLSGIGLAFGEFRVTNANRAVLVERRLRLPDHGEALKALVDWLRTEHAAARLECVGHRLVHGGSRFSRPQAITPDLMDALEELRPFAPDHLPHEIKAIRVLAQAFPKVRQVACFDTAFHRNMPRVAQIYALPHELWREGVMRYGFHGLSYEFILGELTRETGAGARGRVVMAHLGNGASLAAVQNGQSRDTTMGFSPAGGLVMSTRTGDLDPGVILYLLKEKGLEFSAVNRMVNKEGGLLGVSGLSPAIKELLEAEPNNPRAAEAVALFCYQVRKFVGAFAAVLGGLDTLVFTGGIGENAPLIRSRVCRGLGFLGIGIDERRNTVNAPVISAKGASVTVRVIKTNEELMIARHASHVMRNEAAARQAKKEPPDRKRQTGGQS